MHKVSIIVPVYNTEKYLPRCIESILAQSFTDFELILVNDGSTDNSGKICDEYALIDSRIVVIHKENSGANNARKCGIEKSSGEWISFVDSDDTISQNALNVLYNNVFDDVDIVIGQIDGHKYDAQILTIDEYRKALLTGKYPSPVARLIRKSLFYDNIFNIPQNITIGEDLLMNIRISFKASNNIVIIPNIIYRYQIREDSIFHSHKYCYEYFEDFFKYYISSIPKNDIKKYNSDIFYFAYDKWSNFCGYRYRIPKTWKNFDIFKYVINNKASNQSLLRPFDNLIIMTNNLIIRFILIILKKISNHYRF